mmetsp:Transcript_120785/g.189460  ORF Transcript_120785/g.189460 Transcript_120785/m.189460 type:complete len:307 (+) Transcript_120785:778-1698(+)
MKSPMAAQTAARPTKEWKSATNWGSWVTSAFAPIILPRTKPPPKKVASLVMSPRVAICVRVAATAPITPRSPIQFPVGAVETLPRAAIPLKHAIPETSKAPGAKLAPDVTSAPHKSAMAIKLYCGNVEMSPSRRNIPIIRDVIVKPPPMLRAEAPTAIGARAAPQPVPWPRSSRPPITVRPEMALVSDMRGEWSAGATPCTAPLPARQASAKVVRVVTLPPRSAVNATIAAHHFTTDFSEVTRFSCVTRATRSSSVSSGSGSGMLGFSMVGMYRSNSPSDSCKSQAPRTASSALSKKKLSLSPMDW